MAGVLRDRLTAFSSDEAGVGVLLRSALMHADGVSLRTRQLTGVFRRVNNTLAPLRPPTAQESAPRRPRLAAVLTRPVRAHSFAVMRSDHNDRKRASEWPASRYTDGVRIWLDLPDDVVEQIAEKGTDLSRAALEALAIDAYRMNRLSDHQMCELLDIPSRYELDGFLKRHGVPLDYTIEDFDREGAISARLWHKRQEDLAAERGRVQRPE